VLDAVLREVGCLVIGAVLGAVIGARCGAMLGAVIGDWYDAR